MKTQINGSAVAIQKPFPKNMMDAYGNVYLMFSATAGVYLHYNPTGSKSNLTKSSSNSPYYNSVLNSATWTDYDEPVTIQN